MRPGRLQSKLSQRFQSPRFTIYIVFYVYRYFMPSPQFWFKKIVNHVYVKILLRTNVFPYTPREPGQLDTTCANLTFVIRKYK